MGGGVTARVRGVFLSIAFMIFMVASAYLLLEAVIALSAQGEPTGSVAPFTGAQIVYPLWYQAPEFLDSAWIALVAYPVAAVFYGIGMVTRLAERRHSAGNLRLPTDFAAPEIIGGPSPGGVLAAETTDDICVVGADRRIQHITPSAARLFGLTPREMQGQSLETFLVPVDLPKLDALVAAASADRPRAFAATVAVVLPDATIALLDISCAAGVNATALLAIKPHSERGRLDDQLAALWY